MNIYTFTPCLECQGTGRTMKYLEHLGQYDVCSHCRGNAKIMVTYPTRSVRPTPEPTKGRLVCNEKIEPLFGPWLWIVPTIVLSLIIGMRIGYAIR
jgi:hypothetical protein